MVTFDTSPAFQTPAFSFSDAIRAHARQRGGDIAFVQGTRSRSWREFDRAVATVAEALIRAGIERGDRVALLGGSSPWMYEAMFGAARAGAVMVPLSTMLPAPLLARLMEDCSASVLFSGAGYEGVALEAAQSLQRRPRVVLESEDEAASFAVFAEGCAGTFGGAKALLNTPFSIIYSSGTTGFPKGIVHSHEARLGLARQFGGAFGISARARTVIATPPSSNGTMLLLLPTLYEGGTCILTTDWSPDGFFDLLHRQAPTHAFLVPMQFGAVFKHPRAATADYSSLRCLMSAGAPMPAHVKELTLRYASHCFHEVWGFTEGVASVIFPDEVRVRPASVGRAFSGTEIRLVDEQGRELVWPATGELVGRSTMMMQGYLNRDDANEEIRWRDAAGEEFLRTGDMAEIDADGFITIRGRLKEMVISGGLNVYPSDLEAVLRQHPGVDDAAVVGVPHEKWGEAPVAFVVARTGASLQGGDVMEWVNAQVAKHQRLIDLQLRLEDLPRNALGKVLKRELRQAYLS